MQHIDICWFVIVEKMLLIYLGTIKSIYNQMEPKRKVRYSLELKNYDFICFRSGC